MTTSTPAVIQHLRQAMARIEGQETDLVTGGSTLALGVRAIDIVLQGGLVSSSLHEVAPATMRDFGSAMGLVLALAARATHRGQSTFWIQTDFSVLETGTIYGAGDNLLGLPARQLLILKVARPIDALWAMEEALKCRALSSVIAELPGDGSIADLTMTRRLTLAARAGGGFGFLFRHKPSSYTSSAETRWEVTAAPSRPDRFGGLGRTAFILSLTKNRRGPTGCWPVSWDHHEHVFSSLSFGLAQAAIDRPDRAPFGYAG